LDGNSVISCVDGPKACHHLIAGMSGTIEEHKLAELA
jgi:hypothetical protein